MAAGVNLLKLFDADFGVNGRGVELLVAEQLLDEPDVRPVFQHVRRAGVPQDVAAAFALQPGLAQPRRHHARDHVGIERPAVAGQEQRLRARVQAQTRAHVLSSNVPASERPARRRARRGLFCPCPNGHAACAARCSGRTVPTGKARCAGCPSSKRVPASPGHGCPAGRPRRARPAAVPLRGSVSTSCGRRFSMPGQFQLAGRIVQDDVLPGEPAEEVLERCPSGCAACSSPSRCPLALVQRQSQR